MRAPVAATLFLLARCAPAEVFLVDPSVPIDWLAAYVPEGGPTAGAPPTAFGPDGAVPIEPSPDHEVRLLGWPDKDLRPLIERVGRLPSATDAPRAAERCEPHLPPPRWSARLEGGEVTPDASPFDEALTSHWLDQVCDPLDPSALLYSVGCWSAPCPVSLNVVERCRLRLDLGACGGDDVEIGVEPLGGICAAGSLGSCEALDPVVPGSIRRIACTRPACAIDLFPRERPVPFTVATQVVADVPAEFPSRMYGDRLYYGYLGDLLVRGDSVLVTRFASYQRQSLCGDPSPTELVYLDADSLAVTRRVAGPRCLTRLAPGDNGNVFGVVFSPAAELVELDPNGAELRRAPLAPISVDVADLIRGPGGRLYALTIQGDSMRVLWIDPLSLTIDATIEIFGRGYAITATEDQLIVLDDDKDGVHFIDPETRAVTEVASYQSLLSDLGDTFVAFHAGTRQAILSVDATKPFLALIDRTGVVRTAFEFERSGVPGAFAPIPNRPHRFAVSFVDPDTKEGWYAELDPGSASILPVMVPGGLGAASRVRADAKGRLWFLRAAAGAVDRVTPQLR